MFDVMKLIQSDGILLHPPGHAYQGKSIVPFGYGVVFTNITRKQFAQTDLHEVFPEDRCVFKDEMSESVDAEVFRTRLWKMVPPRIGSPLTLPAVRSLACAAVSRDPDSADRAAAGTEVRRARRPNPGRDGLAPGASGAGLGEGHRIIRGVAGSGKTLILAFRAEHLARAASKPVLILCYANGIAGRLEDAMQARGVEDRVQVRTFHSWCYQMLKTYGIPGPTEAEYPDYNQRLAVDFEPEVSLTIHSRKHWIRMSRRHHKSSIRFPV